MITRPALTLTCAAPYHPARAGAGMCQGGRYSHLIARSPERRNE
jgi:hypothetical protein